MTKPLPSPETIRTERAFQIYLALLNSDHNQFIDWSATEEIQKNLSLEEKENLTPFEAPNGTIIFKDELTETLLLTHIAYLSFEAADAFISYN